MNRTIKDGVYFSLVFLTKRNGFYLDEKKIFVIFFFPLVPIEVSLKAGGILLMTIKTIVFFVNMTAAY